MLNLVHAEWMKLRYNRSVFVMAAGMMLISLWWASSAFGILPERITAEQINFYGGKEMLRGEEVFHRTMKDSSFTTMLSIVFAAFFVGAEFTGRTINQAIYAGHSRFKIFVVKVTEFYVVAGLISFLYPLVSLLLYGIPWLQTLTFGDFPYVLRCLGLRWLLESAWMSVSLLFAFLYRDVIRSMATALGVTLVLSQLFRFTVNFDESSLWSRIVESLPMYQQRLITDEGLTSGQLAEMIIPAVAMMAITLVVSYLSFRKAELK